jgi:hypothetical protein
MILETSASQALADLKRLSAFQVNFLSTLLRGEQYLPFDFPFYMRMEYFTIWLDLTGFRKPVRSVSSIY